MEIAAFGDENFVMGFQIAGIKNSYIAEGDANKIVEEIMGREDVGIVVTEKKTFDTLSEHMREVVLTAARPAFVVLSFDISAEENLRLMIKRAMGIDLWK